ncbi:MAG: hypothetical protein HKN92_11115 [Chitinophagales bacterium]|nr:hypothetical protein [Chitinophagales bacterium]
MKKFLKLLEKAWIFAMVAALAVAIYNFYKEPVFSHKIYFPIFVAIFCFIVYRTKKNHRKFLETIKQNNDNPEG